MRILYEVGPDEVYHLGAQSHVAVSFEEPEYTAQADALGTLRLLESIRLLKLKCRFYNASTSELFGSSPPPQNELTPFHPRSPYGVAKLYGHWMTVNYREAYKLHASNGILFNHESPRRGETFVTRKITKALNRIKQGKQDKLILGNLEAKRDWGHARDYVEAMYLMLQQPIPQDYVISTGESHSVREFIEEAANVLDLDLTGRIEQDDRLKRPAEVDHLQGDSSKARKLLNWSPKTTFKELVKEMVLADEPVCSPR